MNHSKKGVNLDGISPDKSLSFNLNNINLMQHRMPMLGIDSNQKNTFKMRQNKSEWVYQIIKVQNLFILRKIKLDIS